MQPLNGYSSSIIEGSGILGDYPVSFDPIKRSSVASLQRTHHSLKFSEVRPRQTVLPFTSRQNVSSDYTMEEDYTSTLTPASDPRSWSSGYSHEVSQVSNQNDEYFDSWEHSTEGSGRYVADTFRLNNGADNHRRGTVNRFLGARHPPPPSRTSLHPLPLHPPPQQHTYLHPLSHSIPQSHQPLLGDAFHGSMTCQKIGESFVTNHMQQATRRDVAKQHRPFLPEVHRRESRDPTGSYFGQECFEEDVEISLKKTRRVLLPTPKDCSAGNPSSSNISCADSAPTTAAETTTGVWISASTLTTQDEEDAETIVTPDDDETRVLGPSPSATHGSRPHHHRIRPDATTVTPKRQPTRQPPSVPPPHPSHHQQLQQQQHRQVMRTTSLDESDARSNGSREAKGFSIGRSSSSISDSDDRQKDSYICQICRVRCQSLENFDVHMQSDEHRRLMKAVASVHLQKTKQRLKTLKVNRKQRLRFTNNAKRRNHRLVGLKRSSMTSPATTAATPPTTKDGIKCKTTIYNTQAEKAPTNGTQRPGKEKSGSCLPNKSKFLLECTLHRQNEDDAHPIWLASDRNGAKSNASQPRGQECIVSVSGFLCKLCNKFYNDETSAKVTHCSSRKHICKYREMLKMMKTFRENSTAENTTCGC